MTKKIRETPMLDELENGRVKTLLSRIIYRNSMMPDQDSDSKNAVEYYSGRVTPPVDDSVKGYKGDTKFNCEQGIEELDEIEKLNLDLSAPKKERLVELREYIERLKQI